MSKKEAKFKFAAGRAYVCTKSASPGYKEGKIYIAYDNDNGYTCLMGDDGFEDLCSMLVSTFKYAEDRNLSVVE